MRKQSNKKPVPLPVLGILNKEPAVVAGFALKEYIRDKLGPMFNTTYRPAELYDTGKKWFVFYHYRHPETKKMKRFKVYHDMNRIKDPVKKAEFAALLKDAINLALKDGFNPFDVKPKERKKVWTLTQALAYYQQKLPELDIRPKTRSCYISMVKMVQESKNPLLNDYLAAIPKRDLLALLEGIKTNQKWGNATYNGYFGYFKTMLNWCVKNELIKVNVLEGTEKKKTVSEKHQAFTRIEFEAYFKAVADTPLYWFSRFVYYTGTRPKSETRLLQVKHIDFDNKQIIIPAEVSKNKTYGRVPLADELVNWLQEFKGKPPDYYIFGRDGILAPHNYYSNLFAKVRKICNLSDNVTVYSLKHSRAIHLAEANVSPYAIMKLFRHSSLEMTMVYLRNLGISISREAVDI